MIAKPNKHNNPSPIWNNLSYSKLNLEPKQIDYLARNRNSCVVLTKNNLRNAATLQPTGSEMSTDQQYYMPPSFSNQIPQRSISHMRAQGGLRTNEDYQKK